MNEPNTPGESTTKEVNCPSCLSRDSRTCELCKDGSFFADFRRDLDLKDAFNAREPKDKN